LTVQFRVQFLDASGTIIREMHAAVSILATVQAFSAFAMAGSVGDAVIMTSQPAAREPSAPSGAEGVEPDQEGVRRRLPSRQELYASR
jgi:hypothetical protein